jgi:hypothetical protein
MSSMGWNPVWVAALCKGGVKDNDIKTLSLSHKKLNTNKKFAKKKEKKKKRKRKDSHPNSNLGEQILMTDENRKITNSVGPHSYP